MTLALVTSASESIVVEIGGFKNFEGDIVVAIIDKESEFLSEVFWSNVYPVNGKNSLEVNISVIPPGEYVVSIFIDRNANGQLDKILIGIPVEPNLFQTIQK